MSQTGLILSTAGWAGPQAPKEAAINISLPPPAKPAPVKGWGPWHNIFQNAFGGIVAEMLSTTFINYASFITQLLADERKDAYMKKIVRLHVGYDGEVGCGMGGTEQKGTHFGYPAPAVHNLGDFSTCHYRMSRKSKNNLRKENYLYSKSVINALPKFESYIHVCKTLIKGFYLYGDDRKGFIAAIKYHFALSVRESFLDLANINVITSKKADIVTLKLAVPLNKKKLEIKFPKTWARIQRIQKIRHRVMEESGKHVFLTIIVKADGVYIFCKIHKDKLVLCKIVQKQTPWNKKYIPLANPNGAGPRTVDVNSNIQKT